MIGEGCIVHISKRHLGTDYGSKASILCLGNNGTYHSTIITDTNCTVPIRQENLNNCLS